MYFSHLIRFVTFVVLSCAGVSAQAEEKYSDGLLCSSIYFIMSGFYGDNKEAGEMLMGLQQSFEVIFMSRQNSNFTNGQLAELMHNHLIYLGDLYDKNASDVYELEMQCNEWRDEAAPIMVEAGRHFATQNFDKGKALLKTVPQMQKGSYDSSNQRWSVTKNIIDVGFSVWDQSERMTPFSFKQKLKNSLEKD